MPDETPRARLDAVEATWRRRWKESRAYVRRPEAGRAKFFATYPYSYMNGFAHLGHAFTMTRNDVATRYQRMLGRNALFPMGFHVTGTPIVAAANRVAEGEPVQRRILVESGIPESGVPAFADPKHWVRYFPKEWREDIDRLGLGVDWSREFHTTDLNPHYDAFIRWQFRRLRDGGYVERGRHPIVWCPKDAAPVADHDRVEGEGETPQEWVLYRMRVASGDLPVAAGAAPGSAFLVAATLRPDTVFGQTNVWVDPAATYRGVRVRTAGGEETWIVNDAAAAALPFQVDVAGPAFEVRGSDLVGVRVVAPGTGAEIPVLPARFIRHDKGTGIVTSVPSDSPQDWLSLRALQDGAVDAPASVRDAARAIRVVPVLRTEKYGEESARRAVEESGASSDTDAARILEATELAYQAGFYGGTMLANAGAFAGKPVPEAKEAIKEWLVLRGEAARFYWPSGKVVCRCLTPATVKIVSDQWFMRYGDPAWKKRAHEAVDAMAFHPELLRKQFHYVVDWLHDWACARESGLGTRLPWDERWIVESLSDSTIYMAYYALAPHLERGTVTGAAGERAGVDAKDLTDVFFDHVLLGKGRAEDAVRGSVTRAVVDACRAEFLYWYPVDFRNSGKDLIQNHLTFFVFNHVAIWPDQPDKWPRAIAANGWLLLNGEKMSKSSGNFMTLREGIDRFGATGLRLALVNAGEGVDDANLEAEFAESGARRMDAWLDFATAKHAIRDDELPVDRWFRSTLARLVGETRAHMDAAYFRSALKSGFFDLQREWAWYLRRCGTPHARVLDEFLDTQNRLLAPFVPHLAEEAHARRGLPGSVLDAAYPAPDPGAIDPGAEAAERFVKGVLDDTREILKVTKIAPRRVLYYTAPAWKRAVHDVAVRLAREGKLAMPALMGEAMQDPDVKRNAKEAPKLAADLVKTLSAVSKDDLASRAAAFDERATLAAAATFLGAELGSAVEVHAADAPGLPDPAGKSRFAAPGRPAIYVE